MHLLVQIEFIPWFFWTLHWNSALGTTQHQEPAASPVYFFFTSKQEILIWAHGLMESYPPGSSSAEQSSVTGPAETKPTEACCSVVKQMRATSCDSFPVIDSCQAAFTISLLKPSSTLKLPVNMKKASVIYYISVLPLNAQCLLTLSEMCKLWQLLLRS